MPRTDLRVDLLGTAFTITVDEDPSYIASIYSSLCRVIENAQKSTGIKDPLKTAILSAFLLCDEMEKLRAGRNSGASAFESMEAEKLTNELIVKIDDFLLNTNISIDSQDPFQGKIFRLENEIKNFAWGSPIWLPDLLGFPNPEQTPCAELWMGSHPNGSSKITVDFYGTPKTLTLAELIERSPEYYLGAGAANKYGALPYLFKLLAAEKPLSIQAHPNLEQARQGFERENAAGIPLDAKERNYKDNNHKPEIICALTPFRVMCGFREIREITELLHKFDCAALGNVLGAVENAQNQNTNNDENPYGAFLNALFTLSADEKQALTIHIRQNIGTIIEKYGENEREWQMVASFASIYPGDSAIISPLYLNVLDLEPGEAVFLPAGVLHAYVHGFGVELMANSDNVLRGGLTQKYVDSGELLGALKLEAHLPPVMKNATGRLPYTYPSGADEFALSVLSNSDMTHVVQLEREGPVAGIVMEGACVVTFKNGNPDMRFEKGTSFFVPAGLSRSLFTLEGVFTLYIASVGQN
jgi:mannose-6-phosphate isomerase